MKSAEHASALHSPNLFRVGSEDEPRLKLEHARRGYVGEGGDGVRGRAHAADELAERRRGRSAVAVGRHPAPEEVAVVEDVEAFEAEQERRALRQVYAVLDEDGNVLRRGAAEGRLGDDLAVDDGPVVVRAVAVVVYAGRGVERAGGGEHRDRAGREARR